MSTQSIPLLTLLELLGRGGQNSAPASAQSVAPVTLQQLAPNVQFSPGQGLPMPPVLGINPAGAQQQQKPQSGGSGSTPKSPTNPPTNPPPNPPPPGQQPPPPNPPNPPGQQPPAPPGGSNTVWHYDGEPNPNGDGSTWSAAQNGWVDANGNLISGQTPGSGNTLQNGYVDPATGDIWNGTTHVWMNPQTGATVPTDPETGLPQGNNTPPGDPGNPGNPGDPNNPTDPNPYDPNQPTDPGSGGGGGGGGGTPSNPDNPDPYQGGDASQNSDPFLGSGDPNAGYYNGMYDYFG